MMRAMTLLSLLAVATATAAAPDPSRMKEIAPGVFLPILNLVRAEILTKTFPAGRVALAAGADAMPGSVRARADSCLAPSACAAVPREPAAARTRRSASRPGSPPAASASIRVRPQRLGRSLLLRSR